LGPSVKSATKANYVPGRASARDVKAGNQRIIGKNLQQGAPAGLIDARLVDKLKLAGERRQPTNAHAEEVRVFSVVLQPLQDLALVRERTRARVDRARLPAVLLRPVAAAVELARVASRVPKKENHRLAVGQTSLRHLEDPVNLLVRPAV